MSACSPFSDAGPVQQTVADEAAGLLRRLLSEPESRIMGRWTPRGPVPGPFGQTGAVALGALDGNRLELIEFYHDGPKITEDPLQSMACLMEARPEK